MLVISAAHLWGCTPGTAEATTVRVLSAPRFRGDGGPLITAPPAG